jgi:hypothetical protein
VIARAAILYGPRLLCLFPLLVLSSFYSTWIAGRVELGYWPRSSLDDPAGIGGPFFHLYYHSTELLVRFGFPMFGLALVTLVLICLVKRPDGWKRSLVELVFAVLAFCWMMVLVRWDPLRVVEWYFD